MKYSVGIDLGGTTTKIGVFSHDGDLLYKAENPTKAVSGRDIIFGDIADGVRKLILSHGIRLDDCDIGLAMPGPIEKTGYVEAVVNLNMYDFVPADILSPMLNGKHITVVNDANAAALGEMWQGGGKGYQNLILITLGTGVGSGIVINGRVIYGAHGLGGEIGHIWVNPDEPELCKCGGRGCLDQIASATGIVKNAYRFLEKESGNSILRGRDNLTAKDVIDAAKAGDHLADKALNYCMEFLGKAIADITYIVDPDIVVIGGGISKAGNFILNMIYDHYKNYPKVKKTLTPFALATLGGDAGMYGAAYLVTK